MKRYASQRGLTREREVDDAHGNSPTMIAMMYTMPHTIPSASGLTKEGSSGACTAGLAFRPASAHAHFHVFKWRAFLPEIFALEPCLQG